MQIFIKTRTGKQVVLEAKYTDTVASVKAQIRDKEGISPAQQCLIYDRMVLDDGRTLAGCGVQRESTIHLELPGTMGSVADVRGGTPTITLPPWDTRKTAARQTHKMLSNSTGSASLAITKQPLTT